VRAEGENAQGGEGAIFMAIAKEDVLALMKRFHDS
jgi:hypothetical protein